MDIHLPTSSPPLLIWVALRIHGRSAIIVSEWNRGSSVTGTVMTKRWEGAIWMDSGAVLEVEARNDTGATVSVGCDYITMRRSEYHG